MMGFRGEGNKEGDVVLIQYQDKPMAYARIETIEPDVKRDWYQVTLLFLTIPAQTVTWILRRAYIDGDPFTMGGQPVRLEKVEKMKTGDRSQETGNRKRETGVRRENTAGEGEARDNGQTKARKIKVIPFKKEK